MPSRARLVQLYRNKLSYPVPLQNQHKTQNTSQGDTCSVVKAGAEIPDHNLSSRRRCTSVRKTRQQVFPDVCSIEKRLKSKRLPKSTKPRSKQRTKPVTLSNLPPEMHLKCNKKLLAAANSSEIPGHVQPTPFQSTPTLLRSKHTRRGRNLDSCLNLPQGMHFSCIQESYKLKGKE
jgi:hypothetical protein